MRFVLEPLLQAHQVEDWSRALSREDTSWLPGADTAGWHARSVKRNHQLDRRSPLHAQLASQVQATLLAHPLMQAAALPVAIHGVLFSRSSVGEGYGSHVDNAFMTGGRSDLSFTLFLSDPETYSGGELVLESPTGEEALRCPAGHALVYPSTQLHRVEPVRDGVRLAAVGWIQSRVRRADQRELLFELDTARRAIFQRDGKDEIFDLISRSYTNLLRQWGE
ncbi:Fe2+-dependent dioxygenase [Synechococcus sp. BA-124 BA4]|uniref:Fe2+-dependent dioxygenase n=1 Tax=unclassified Synechococcus TaxID=2626047 RepID=UPI0018CE9477|nr:MULTISPECIES: Fe2+-dependent dioxygenase [unclassified Synechococcus]MEA5399956.1 Fe2+-dependent dioxygenase [Synechococcus sp. BA-124 BA4]QPN56150.1 Fe2+-dependent dioxygenase [Synechococcus sp. CBW1107]CAK6699052.1 PKHD-type hydroxylase [Synechococcus sp. CBW1107]